MVNWIATAVLAMIVVVVGPGRVESIAAASSLPSAVLASQTSGASIRSTDISARRHVRHYHHHRYYHTGYRHYRYGHRGYYPRYYARPYYYEPYPSYAPAPLAFGFSFGFGPWW
jgi:hypothetical protein